MEIVPFDRRLLVGTSVSISSVSPALNVVVNRTGLACFIPISQEPHTPFLFGSMIHPGERKP